MSALPRTTAPPVAVPIRWPSRSWASLRARAARLDAFVVTCTALALTLRAPFVGAPMGIDEGGVAWVARQWFTAHGSLYGGQWIDRPPLLIALNHVVVGAGAPGIRALGALAAVAIVLAAARAARALAGIRAARIAALTAALLTGVAAIEAVYAPAELLAAAPAVGSIAALLAAHRTGRVRTLALAGALAVAAMLVKQSFLDAGAAGVVYLAARSLTGGPRRLAAWGAYAVGALAALIPVAGWLAISHTAPSTLLDAMFGFRLHSLTVLQSSNLPLTQRLGLLGTPALRSGLVVLVPLAAAGLWTLRRDRLLALTLAAWMAAGIAGVLGGGSYWPHYLIQLVPVTAIGVGVIAARGPGRFVTGAAALATVVAAMGGARYAIDLAHDPPFATTSRVAAWVRTHDRPGDTFYALYARANLNELVGLPTPYPYSWSLLDRVRPDAHRRLLTLLRSRHRPTWIVQWQRPSHWGLDPTGAIARTLRHHYRVVARFGHHPVLHADSAPPAGA